MTIRPRLIESRDTDGQTIINKKTAQNPNLAGNHASSAASEFAPVANLPRTAHAGKNALVISWQAGTVAMAREEGNVICSSSAPW